MTRKLRLPDSAALSGGSGKMEAPSAARNIGPILETLSPFVPQKGRALELAAGTGQHAVAFARAFPGLHWQPTEPDAQRRASITAWAAEAALPNLAAPIALDACAPGWAKDHGPVDLLYLVNLLHLISEAEMSVLLDEAAQVLAPRGLFALYGPFLRDGLPVSDGDAAFDASLRAQDPLIGYKDIGTIVQVFEVLGCTVDLRAMPANNILALIRPRV